MEKLRPALMRVRNSYSALLEGQIPQTKTGRIIKITSFVSLMLVFSVYVGVVSFTATNYLQQDATAIAQVQR